MADYCKQCAIEYGLPEKDLCFDRMKDGVKLELEDGMGWGELCEGCGPCIVLDDGTYVDPNCLKDHGKHLIEGDNNGNWDRPV